MEVYAAQGYSNGSYNPDTLIQIYPQDPRGLKDKYIVDVRNEGFGGNQNDGLIVHMKQWYNSRHEWLPQGTPPGYHSLVVRVKTKKIQYPVPDSGYYHNSTRFEKHDWLHGRVDVTSTEGGKRGFLYVAHFPVSASGSGAVTPTALTNVTIKKVDLQNNLIKSADKQMPAEFKVYAEEKGKKGKLLKEAYLVDGTLSLSSLPYPTTLYLEEVKPPTGYFQGKNVNYKLVIDASGKTSFFAAGPGGAWTQIGTQEAAEQHEFAVKNIPYPSLRITKLDETSKEKLAGAVFELKGPNQEIRRIGMQNSQSMFLLRISNPEIIR
ncbi:hypothetical protein RQN30_11635 [Arcanobacterium hippocoleae]